MEHFFNLYLSGLIIKNLGTDKGSALKHERKNDMFESGPCRDQLAKFPQASLRCLSSASIPMLRVRPR